VLFGFLSLPVASICIKLKKAVNGGGSRCDAIVIAFGLDRNSPSGRHSIVFG
jgi:hypothetical protein